MPVVKILSSSNNFTSVRYNQMRCDAGQGELVSVQNFSGTASYLSYQEYLTHWTNQNRRIKKGQLHVTISAKGKELSKEQLKTIGEEWMKKMGYGDNPYLIYFHSNTKNNHIHIISSRVDKYGNKISDSFEKERSLKSLNEVMKEQPDVSHSSSIAKLLRFSFSTKYQFIELAKKAGFYVRIENDGLVLRKGYSTYSISNQLLDFCIKRYHKDVEEKNKKKLQSLIYKYAAQLNTENFIFTMKKKFGVDFIFYGKEGSLNGFTIIDNNNEAVYKGSEVFSLKKLVELLDIPQNPMFEFEYSMHEMFDKNPYATYDEMKQMLAENYLYHIEGSQLIDDTTGEAKDYNEKLYKRLQYNTRLVSCFDKYHPIGESAILLAAKLGHVRGQDLKKYIDQLPNSPSIDNNREYYSYVFKKCFEDESAAKTILNSHGISFVQNDNKLFVYDSLNKELFESAELGIPDSDIHSLYDKYKNEAHHIEYNNYDYESDESDFIDLQNVNMFGFLYVGGASGGNSKPRKRRLNK